MKARSTKKALNLTLTPEAIKMGRQLAKERAKITLGRPSFSNLVEHLIIEAKTEKEPQPA